jgi:hypothetical protein
VRKFLRHSYHVVGACLSPYRVFNKDTSCVETACDEVFDETNDSQVEQYDLNGVDDEDAPCDALRTIVVGDVRPQEVNEDQPSSN